MLEKDIVIYYIFVKYMQNQFPCISRSCSMPCARLRRLQNERYGGLLHYRKWWERTEVEISVNQKLIRGIPIFVEENTVRVIDDEHSYFISLDKVDYIRTTDGLHTFQNCSKP